MSMLDRLRNGSTANGSGPSPVHESTRATQGPTASSRSPPPQQEVEEPDQLVCAITHVMFRDPVFVPESGNTYERDAIVQYWRSNGQPRDPLTNAVLSSDALHTNWGTRRDVQGFLDSNPGYVPQGWPDREVPAPVRVDSQSVFRMKMAKYSLLVVIIAFAAAGLISCLKSSIGITGESFHSSTAGLPRHVLQTPKASRLIGWNMSSTRFKNDRRVSQKSLSISLPATFRLPFDAIVKFLFSLFWLGFIGVWTYGAMQAGAPWVFSAFSVPFWGAGIVMLIMAASSCFVGHHIAMTSSTEDDGAAMMQFSKEIFGYSWWPSYYEIEDLDSQPQITCEDTKACNLRFDFGDDEQVFPPELLFRRDEARWLQKVLQDHLVAFATDHGRDASRFMKAVKERRPRRQDPRYDYDDHDYHGSGWGFDDGWGYGPGGFGLGGGPGVRFHFR